MPARSARTAVSPRARRTAAGNAPAALELHARADADGPRTSRQDLGLRADAADHEPGHVVALVEHVLGEQLDDVIAPIIAGEQQISMSVSIIFLLG